MIKILYKYIIKTFTNIFMLTVLAFSLVVAMSGLFDNISNNFYTKYKPSFDLIILHLITNLPEWLMQGLPIATLLALLFSLGNLSKRNEITAMKAAGINVWRVISVFLIMGVIIGIGDFATREFVVSKTSFYNEIVKKEKIKKEEILIVTDYYNRIVSLPDNARMTIGHLDTQANTMKDVVMEKYNANFEIQRLVLAKEAVWENGAWILKNGVMRDFDSYFWNEIYFKDCNSNISMTPEDMTINTIKEERYDAMNISEFKKHINQLKTFGQAAIKPRIILNTRFASAFSHVIVMMIGIPFVIGFGSKLNRILNFTLALGAVFVFWGIQAIARSLGENLILSPIIAAWLPCIIFSTIGIYLLIEIKK
ncbi:MAG: LptF/LptG family permease [Endomicrobium sp.]|uniref:LptF/LptG family permease n=1 Tax=Candidatus Endomicrobiellum pyrsonymphae TaxID=1408203 RepID=UPI003586997E|nr:LptF/LptG family permease [Endomicrobium sp.]